MQTLCIAMKIFYILVNKELACMIVYKSLLLN